MKNQNETLILALQCLFAALKSCHENTSVNKKLDIIMTTQSEAKVQLDTLLVQQTQSAALLTEGFAEITAKILEINNKVAEQQATIDQLIANAASAIISPELQASIDALAMSNQSLTTQAQQLADIVPNVVVA